MSTLYEVSSLIAFVMNKPNSFAQVLGLLNRGNQIDVISISGNWAYFKYNNNNAYVNKSNLKILDSESIEVKGSITLKYLNSDTNSEIYCSEILNKLELGSYSYKAKTIYGYILQNDSIQSVDLTKENSNQDITFYYTQILGSIVIKYIDINTNIDIYESKTIKNLSLGTYIHGSINIPRYMLSDDETKTVTLTETSPNKIINFKYTEILGSVTIKYIDSSSSVELLPADTFTNLKLGKYSYTSKYISGYSLVNDSIQTVELTDNNYNIEIKFKYSELFGSVTIKYLDSSLLSEIGTSTVISNLSLGTYSYTAKSFEGYDIVGDFSQSVTLNDNNLNPIISFIYSRISGNITIEYLDSSTLSEIAPSTTISNIALGSYSYDAIYIDNYEVDGDSSISTILTTTEPNKTISFKYNEIEIPEDLNWNEVPYISTYYIKPIVKPGEEVFIDYYITDYYYKDYLEEDYSETFTVTVRVEGQDDKLYHYLKAGDHHVSLGSFSTEGEYTFSILCTDKYGRNSHELFNSLLVQDDIQVKEYIMTEDDLVGYNIKNTDNYEEKIYVKVDKLTDTTTGTKIEEVANSTIIPSNKYICFIGTTESDDSGNPIMQTKAARFWLNTIVKYSSDYDKSIVYQESKNTRIGLQKLISDTKVAGYNKLTLLPGIYRIDNWVEKDTNNKLTGSETIKIPENFTLNMNGSTLKQNEFAGCNGVMISLENNNSHLINGIIEGDYFAHDYANSTNNSEWVIGVSSSSNNYMSMENVIVKDITGYGFGGGGNKNLWDKDIWRTEYIPVDIDRNTGLEIPCEYRLTSKDPIDISDVVKYKNICIMKYGYQGITGDSWNIIFHYYDENNNYIKSVDTRQYRTSIMPNNAKYIKITTLGGSFGAVHLNGPKSPKNVSLNNDKFINCRCVGVAGVPGMDNSIVENCEFTLCGQSGAFCAMDVEDGWDFIHDFTLKNCNFYNNYRNDFLTTSGHNIILEDLNNSSLYFWPRSNSYVIRNCNNINTANLGIGTLQLTGYPRVYNNTFKASTSININNNSTWSLCLKDSSLYGIVTSSSNTSVFLRCNIYKNSSATESTANLLNGTFRDCHIYERNTSHNSNSKFYNCIIENLSENTTSCNNYYENCTISNFIIKIQGSTENSPMIFQSCNIINSLIQSWSRTPYVSFYSCNIDNTSSLINIDISNMDKPILLSNNTIKINNNFPLINISDNSTVIGPGDIITLENNIITMPKSQYVIGGNLSNSINKISIITKNNSLSPTSLLLYNSIINEKSNITITEE